MTARVAVAVRIDAPPARVFDAFVGEIGSWWRPSPLFPFTPGRSGRLDLEPGPDGRLVERYDDGTSFQIGEVREWQPPDSLVLSSRMATFAPEQSTEVRVRFEPVAPGEQTRVTVEHIGWDTIPQEHAARHGFPLDAFQHRLAEAWQRHLRSLGDRLQPT